MNVPLPIIVFGTLFMIGSGFEFFATNRAIVWAGRVLLILVGIFVVLPLYEDVFVGLLIGIGLGIIMIRSTIVSKELNQKWLDKKNRK